MKKKIIISIVIIIVLAILLVPIPMRLKDGGSVEYKAILYTITKYHRLSLESSETGYIDGIGIKILGMEIYNNTKDRINTGISQEKETYFYGRVIESSEKYIIVEPYEDEDIRNSSDQISIGLGENNDMIYPVGTNVKITYTGEIMESYPAQVRATKIEIAENNKTEDTVFYPDFITKDRYTLDSVRQFCDENNITLEIEYITSSKYKSGTLISQSEEAETEVISGSTLKITVVK